MRNEWRRGAGAGGGQPLAEAHTCSSILLLLSDSSGSAAVSLPLRSSQAVHSEDSTAIAASASVSRALNIPLRLN